LEKLSPNNATSFTDAFVKAFDLIDNQVDRNELKPIIILLTDGLDHTFENTIKFIGEVSHIFIIYLYFFYRKWKKKDK